MPKEPPFDVWYKDNYKRIVRLVSFKTMNKEVAKDIVSDIMIGIYEKYLTIDDIDAYINSSISKRTNLYHRAKYKNVSIDEQNIQIKFFKNVVDPEYLNTVNTLEAELSNVLGSLSEQDREIYLLYRSNTLTKKALLEAYTMNRYTFDILIDRVDSQIKRLMPSQNLFNTTPKPNSKYNERG